MRTKGFFLLSSPIISGVTFSFASGIASEDFIAIYQNDVALVKEVRRVTFPKGEGETYFQDLPSSILSSWVSVSCPGVVSLSLSYQYEPLTSDRLFKLTRGKELSIVLTCGDTVRGTLIGEPGELILRLTSGDILQIPLSTVKLMLYPSQGEIPYTIPTLIWRYRSAERGERGAILSYLTRGVSWKAHYSLVLYDEQISPHKEGDPNFKSSMLTGIWEGWANIHNQTEGEFRDFKVLLVAGDIQLEQRPEGPLRALSRDAATFKALSGEWQEPQMEETFEYKTYKLDVPQTLIPGENKRVALFSSATLSGLQKLFRYDPQMGGRWGVDGGKKVLVGIKFNNSKENGLGRPMPGGVVSIYQSDPSGAMLLLGQDQMEELAIGEDAFIKLGYAFDLEGERVVKEISRGGNEQWVQIVVRNRKTEKVRVIVVDRFYGDWKFLSVNPPGVKRRADLVEWELEVNPNDSAWVDYRVLYQRK